MLTWVHITHGFTGLGTTHPLVQKKTFVQVVLKRFSQAAQPTACTKGQYKSTMVQAGGCEPPV